MFDRPGADSRAVLVSLDFGEPGYADSLDEIQRLVASAGVKTRAVVQGRRHERVRAGREAQVARRAHHDEFRARQRPERGEQRREVLAFRGVVEHEQIGRAHV